MSKMLKHYASEFKMVPISKEIYADVITPITLLRKLSQKKKRYFLLESIEGGERWGRYSFLGFDPKMRISCKDGVTTTQIDDKVIISNKPMQLIRETLQKYKAPKMADMPPFTGGLVGYFGYNMINYAEPKLRLKSSGGSDYDLMLFDKVIAYDHLKQKIVVIANVETDDVEANFAKAQEELNSMIRLIKSPMRFDSNDFGQVPQLKVNKTEQEFCEMVEKGKEYIKKGDIFQTVLSCKFQTEYSGDLINAYRVLRTTNPSPYMVYLHNEEEEVICSSPETLIKLKDGKLSTMPIGGSRPRGFNSEEDKRLEAELLADEKELAEHDMLVDLARNDMGKISKFGSIKVKGYRRINKYSRIMHITSLVEGIIKDDLDACDAISAILPAGTLSGAPKFRACQIIQELEEEPRGLYGGAIGYMDLTGNMDTCIAIRMAVKKENKVTVQAGAGIVTDSVAKTEYIECKSKAKAVIDALERATEVE